MAEYITLLGAEGVTNAGYTILEAARTMQNAAGSIDEAIRRLQQVNDQYFDRLEAILAEHRKEFKNGHSMS